MLIATWGGGGWACCWAAAVAAACDRKRWTLGGELAAAFRWSPPARATRAELGGRDCCCLPGSDGLMLILRCSVWKTNEREGSVLTLFVFLSFFFSRLCVCRDNKRLVAGGSNHLLGRKQAPRRRKTRVLLLQRARDPCRSRRRPRGACWRRERTRCSTVGCRCCWD